jgi:hypothetical protein
MKVKGVPLHPLAEGVTVTEAETGPVVMFAAVNDGMFPVPPDASPMAVLSFVQLKVVPVTGPLKSI